MSMRAIFTVMLFGLSVYAGEVSPSSKDAEAHDGGARGNFIPRPTRPIENNSFKEFLCDGKAEVGDSEVNLEYGGLNGGQTIIVRKTEKKFVRQYKAIITDRDKQKELVSYKTTIGSGVSGILNYNTTTGEGSWKEVRTVTDLATGRKKTYITEYKVNCTEK